MKTRGRPKLSKTPADIEARLRAKYAKGRKCTICHVKQPIDAFYLLSTGYFRPFCIECDKSLGIQLQRERRWTLEQIDGRIAQLRRQLRELKEIRQRIT